ncbi:MAG: hypothetical protein LBI35_07385 [Burkholderiales bacterium]|nr:hypothetical protein [Burkholderiales bacterium]
MILFGSAAFGGYIAVEPALVGISGLLVAVIAAVSFAFDPSGKAARFELLRDKMSVLGSVAHAYKADELIHQLSILQSNILPGEFETLRNVAYNDVLRENGRDEMIEPLTKTERIFKALFA